MNIQKIILSQRDHFIRFLWERLWLKRLLFKYAKPLYTKLRFYNTFGRVLHFNKRDKDFHEKLFWISVYWRDPLISVCADKFRARKFLKENGCDDILLKQFYVVDRVDDVCWDNLPDRFVMKSNKGSGDNFFCTNKTELDLSAVRNLANQWRKHIYGFETAEYQYESIPFKLIFEEYLVTPPPLIEYQIFCFNGIPESILVRNDLETSGEHPFAVTYSLNWERLYYRLGEEQFNPELEKPANLTKMVKYATKLAKAFLHVRVDFYEYAGKLYFGEMTFSTHGNVFENYKPEVLAMWNEKLQLPTKRWHKRNSDITPPVN